MVRTVTLRPWQKAALERLAATTAADFLAVATPGAGKTSFALTAARQALAESQVRRLVVVVPTVHLKVQWARAAAAFDLHLAPRWSAVEGGLPADMDGVVGRHLPAGGACAGVLRGLSSDAMVVFDEIHHAAEDRVWGDGLRQAFAAARRRLALSGTPFRPCQRERRAEPGERCEHDQRGHRGPAGAPAGQGRAVAQPGRVPPGRRLSRARGAASVEMAEGCGG